MIVGLEVLMEYFYASGEDCEGRAGDRATEEREEVVLKGFEPFNMAVLERSRILVAVEEWG